MKKHKLKIWHFMPIILINILCFLFLPVYIFKGIGTGIKFAITDWKQDTFSRYT